MKTRTKSPFAAFEHLSPNCSKPRKGIIRRLSPHCMAFNGTPERCLNGGRFQTPDPVNGASCNYAIGSDGRIGLGVEETNRAWTTSSSRNDNEALTFEIANNGGAPDWHISDQAINAWLDMSVEICQFYGYSRVHYEAKPDHVIGGTAVENWIASWARPGEMLVTLHRWYKAKACPGNYFVHQLPWLVREMNKRLAGDGYVGEPFVGENSTHYTTIARGTKGDDVRFIQERLNIHGATPELDVDGDFGGLTEAAVKTFQEKHGLAVTGFVQGDTAIELAKDPVKVTPPPPPPAPTGRVVPYPVRITATSLNVRKGPGTEHPVAMTLIRDKNVYTIIEEDKAKDGAPWGKLKSGAGWINLDYTTKL